MFSPPVYEIYTRIPEKRIVINHIIGFQLNTFVPSKTLIGNKLNNAKNAFTENPK